MALEFRTQSFSLMSRLTAASYTLILVRFQACFGFEETYVGGYRGRRSRDLLAEGY